MKLFALTFFLVGNLIAGQAFAGSSQPLTRNECAKAGMKWSDDANVCGEKPEATQAASKSTNPGQPLTRGDCEKAGMTWKDDANVCSSDSTAPNVAGAPPETKKHGLSIVINIDKTKQRMRVLVEGLRKI